MKKIIFCVLAASLVMAFIPVVGVAADEAPIVYGMQRYTAKIYPVNPLDGTVGTPIDTGLSGSSAGPNGLAYDSDNDDLYYTTYPGPATLYYWDIGVSVSSTMVGALGPGHQIADADFYNGKYYYINSATDDLYEVAVSGGVISGTNSYTSISGDAHAWTFGGDIAVSTDEEVIYAVGRCTRHGKYEFFKVDRDGQNFTMIDPDVHTFSLQLAFGLDGKLYGHESKGSGNFYEVDLTNGDLSSAFPNATNYLYTDLASGPRPGADVYIDIKPTSCPNPLNVNGKGVLPVAILGTDTFDVTDVDPETVLLEGVAPLRWSVEDVATPYGAIPEDCDDCTTDGPDSYMDLTLKFDKQAIVAAIGEVEDGECVELTLTAVLNDDTPISSVDWVRIVKKESD